MRMIHEKKIRQKHFQAILDGTKMFEVRLADFTCSEGDILLLKEYNPETKEFTGRTIQKVVTSICNTKNIPFWSEEEIREHGLQVLGWN